MQVRHDRIDSTRLGSARLDQSSLSRLDSTRRELASCMSRPSGARENKKRERGREGEDKQTNTHTYTHTHTHTHTQKPDHSIASLGITLTPKEDLHCTALHCTALGSTPRRSPGRRNPAPRAIVNESALLARNHAHTYSLSLSLSTRLCPSQGPFDCGCSSVQTFWRGVWESRWRRRRRPWRRRGAAGDWCDGTGQRRQCGGEAFGYEQVSRARWAGQRIKSSGKRRAGWIDWALSPSSPQAATMTTSRTTPRRRPKQPSSSSWTNCSSGGSTPPKVDPGERRVCVCICTCDVCPSRGVQERSRSSGRRRLPGHLSCASPRRRRRSERRRTASRHRLSTRRRGTAAGGGTGVTTTTTTS